MRRFTNLFFVLFIGAAVLGICVELSFPSWANNQLGSARELADSLLLLLAFPIWLGLALNRYLPKLTIGALLLFLLWSLVGFWPMEPLAGDRAMLYAACLQLLLGCLTLLFNRCENGKSLFLIHDQFYGPKFTGGNFIAVCLASVLLLPVVLPVLFYATVSSLIDENTAGFVRLQPNGLYMTEKVYVRDEKVIRLTGMIHLGQQQYYDQLSESLAGRQLLILAEGVTDADGLLSSTFSYGKIADLLGLTSQETMVLDARPITPSSLNSLLLPAGSGADILPADIDLREFSAETIAVLNALGKYILNNDSPLAGYNEFNRWAEENLNEQSGQVIMADLIDKRNAHLLGYLSQALHKYNLVVIPWGALHMPGIEQAVLQDGFQLQEEHERLSVDFLLLPFRQILRSFLPADEPATEADLS